MRNLPYFLVEDEDVIETAAVILGKVTVVVVETQKVVKDSVNVINATGRITHLIVVGTTHGCNK